jgi:hypothetical protein
MVEAATVRRVFKAPARRRLVDTRRVLFTQGGYYVATGVLPFVSHRLFETLTGPKREWWLVETVAALVTVIGGVLTSTALRGDASPELLALAAGSATALGGIDVVYVAKRRIAPTYLIDAGVQFGVLAALASSVRR